MSWQWNTASPWSSSHEVMVNWYKMIQICPNDDDGRRKKHRNGTRRFRYASTLRPSLLVAGLLCFIFTYLQPIQNCPISSDWPQTLGPSLLHSHFWTIMEVNPPKNTSNKKKTKLSCCPNKQRHQGAIQHFPQLSRLDFPQQRDHLCEDLHPRSAGHRGARQEHGAELPVNLRPWFLM